MSQNTPWQRALITGASAGIGTAFAKELASRGVHLVLVARDKARLQALAEELVLAHGVTVEVLAADLSDEDAVAAVERRFEDGDFIDLLINNAGIGTFGAFQNTDLNAEIRTVAVNIAAPLRLTRQALNRMAAQRKGAIITISSMDALQPTPYHSVYGASKAFINSLFSSLYAETRKTPITVTTVMPGYVQTEFTARAGVDDALDRVPSWMMLSPEQVAAEALDAASAGKAMCVPGRQYKVMAAVLSSIPHRLGRRIFAVLAPQR